MSRIRQPRGYQLGIIQQYQSEGYQLRQYTSEEEYPLRHSNLRYGEYFWFRVDPYQDRFTILRRGQFQYLTLHDVGSILPRSRFSRAIFRDGVV